jgi:hypothetical protein
MTAHEVLTRAPTSALMLDCRPSTPVVSTAGAIEIRSSATPAAGVFPGGVTRFLHPTGSTWAAGVPTKVLEGRYLVSALGGVGPRNYDIAADGRF